jgi:hypothetical protein
LRYLSPPNQAEIKHFWYNPAILATQSSFWRTLPQQFSYTSPPLLWRFIDYVDVLLGSCVIAVHSVPFYYGLISWHP